MNQPISFEALAMKVGITTRSVSMLDIAQKIGFSNRPIEMSELAIAVDKYVEGNITKKPRA